LVANDRVDIPDDRDKSRTMNPKDALLQKNWRGRLIDARMQILDRQVREVDGVPVGTVNDMPLG
jgi:hypothetical protein